jgi:hypothetical protein
MNIRTLSFVICLSLNSLCLADNVKVIRNPELTINRDFRLQFYPAEFRIALDGLTGMLEDVCSNPKSLRYDDCLLEKLLLLYDAKVDRLESHLDQHELPARWTLNSIVSGYFNERWQSGNEEDEIKPLLDGILIRIAIFNELSRWQTKLEGNRELAAYSAKRAVVPQLKAHFGGLSAISRIYNYAAAIQCNFDYGTEVPVKTPMVLECEDERNALKRIAVTTFSLNRKVLGKIVSDLRNIKSRKEFDDVNNIMIAEGLAQQFYRLYGNPGASQRIYEFITHNGDCEFSSDTDLRQICIQIRNASRRPKDISQGDLSEAVAAAATIAEFGTIDSLSDGHSSAPLSCDGFDTLQKEACLSVQNEMERVIKALVTVFKKYDPQNILVEDRQR